MRPIFTNLELGDSTPEPHAWINFNRFDHDVALYNGYYIFYTDRGEPLELTLNVVPDPAHQLAFQWVTKHGPIRSMTIELNDQKQTVRNPSRGDGQQAAVNLQGILLGREPAEYCLRDDAPTIVQHGRMLR